MNTWAFRAPRLFQPWRILAAFHSPAPLAQRKLLTPSGVGYRNKTQTLTCPLNRGKSSLRLGDFQAGNQIVLSIEGGGSVQSDTLTVESGPLIDVPTLGPILLHGVLRSELETHLATEIGRFIQTPRIQARALIRVSVAGAVGQPGFYALPTDLRLSDAVTLAGGPAGGADPGQIRVERGNGRAVVFRGALGSSGGGPHAGRPGATAWGQNYPARGERICGPVTVSTASHPKLALHSSIRASREDHPLGYRRPWELW